MAELRIALLGPPRVERDGAPIEVDTRKAIALLAYLALHPERHGRDAVAGLLWPDYDTEHARGALRRTLSTLNKAVGPGWLAADRTTVGFARTGFWLDVARFEELLAGCRDHGHPPDDACPACVAPLAEAAGLHRGDFLAGFGLRDSTSFDDWQYFQAERLRRELAGTLERLATAQIGQRRLGRRGRRRPPLAGPGPAARAGPPPAHAHLRLERPARGRPAPVPGLPAGPGGGAGGRAPGGDGRGPRGDPGQPPPAAPRRPPPRRRRRRRPRGAGRPPRPWTRGGPLHGTASPPSGGGPGRGRYRPPPGPPRWAGGRPAGRAGPGVGGAAGRLPGRGRRRAAGGDRGRGRHRQDPAGRRAGRPRPVAGAPRWSSGRCYEEEAGVAYGPFIEGLRGVLAGPGPGGWTGCRGTGWPRPGGCCPSWSRPIRGCPSRGRWTARPPAASSSRGSARSCWPPAPAPCRGCWSSTTCTGPTRRPWTCWPTWSTGSRAGPCWWWPAGGPSRSRPTPACAGWPPRPGGPGRAASWSCGRLDAAGVAELVTAVAPARAGAAGLLHERTEGLPFLVLEYLAVVGDDGELPAALPGGARDLLAARVRGVGDAARQVLATAAVLGRSFDVDTARAASGRSDEEAVAALEELAARGLVHEVAGDVYDFGHGLVRDLVYEQTSLARRRLLHRRVGEAAGRRRPRPPPPGAAGGLDRPAPGAGRRRRRGRRLPPAGRRPGPGRVRQPRGPRPLPGRGRPRPSRRRRPARRHRRPGDPARQLRRRPGRLHRGRRRRRRRRPLGHRAASSAPSAPAGATGTRPSGT